MPALGTRSVCWGSFFALSFAWPSSRDIRKELYRELFCRGGSANWSRMWELQPKIYHSGIHLGLGLMGAFTILFFRSSTVNISDLNSVESIENSWSTSFPKKEHYYRIQNRCCKSTRMALHKEIDADFQKDIQFDQVCQPREEISVFVLPEAVIWKEIFRRNSYAMLQLFCASLADILLFFEPLEFQGP